MEQEQIIEEINMLYNKGARLVNKARPLTTEAEAALNPEDAARFKTLVRLRTQKTKVN